MAYPNYYGGYQPQFYQSPVQPMQPMQDQLGQLRQMQQPAPQQQSNGINWCQGEEGAKAYMVAPGNSVLLMDSDAERFFIKSVDASGMPQPLRVFEYIERTGAVRTPPAPAQTPGVEYVTRQEFDALAARLEAVMASSKPGKKTKEDTDNG